MSLRGDDLKLIFEDDKKLCGFFFLTKLKNTHLRKHPVRGSKIMSVI